VIQRKVYQWSVKEYQLKKCISGELKPHQRNIKEDQASERVLV